MTPAYLRPASLPVVVPDSYWYTIPDLCFLLRVCPNTIRNHLRRIPNQHKCMVTKRAGGRRTTRYWRVSPTGFRLLGHSTGQATWL